MRFAREVRFLRVVRFSGESKEVDEVFYEDNEPTVDDDGVAISVVEGLGKEGGSVLWRWG